ncbi:MULTISPECIES: hypothetical protein [unclassified Bradyrhizobium]|uniref:hypothetical protein n=1 Tax=unclassified Bradyrhizobium TaxID=2631580 RepID=UPI0033938C43
MQDSAARTAAPAKSKRKGRPAGREAAATQTLFIFIPKGKTSGEGRQPRQVNRNADAAKWLRHRDELSAL